jgi:hypothetical protein
MLKHQPTISDCGRFRSGLFPIKWFGLSISRAIGASINVFKQSHSAYHEANENSGFGVPCRH